MIAQWMVSHRLTSAPVSTQQAWGMPRTVSALLALLEMLRPAAPYLSSPA